MTGVTRWEDMRFGVFSRTLLSRERDRREESSRTLIPGEGCDAFEAAQSLAPMESAGEMSDLFMYFSPTIHSLDQSPALGWLSTSLEKIEEEPMQDSSIQ